MSKLDNIFNNFDDRAKEYLEQYPDYKEAYIDPNQKTINHQAQIVQQVRQELFEFIETLISLELNTDVLQIGLGHFGSTHYLLSQICNTVVTVESNWEFIQNYIKREPTYRPEGFTKNRFVYGDSTNEQTVKQTSLYAPFWALFIDGNHEYEHVKQDFENYYPMLAYGGICAFHDTFFEGEKYGVKTFVDELRQQYDVKDIIHSNTTGISYFIKENHE